MNPAIRLLIALIAVALAPVATNAQIVTGLQGASGSAIGPDGALYVTEGAVGRISRVDLKTHEVTTFASGLPKALPGVGIGGVMDVAFIGKTAYALVTLVGTDLAGAGGNVVGIYEIDGPSSSTVIADIGKFSLDNPPATAFFVPTGVQYAMDNYRGGFLVTDGHHNRVLWVTLDGTVSEFKTFDNIVPTGLAVLGKNVYMAEAGPTPHLPQDGKIVSFDWRSDTPVEVAAGAPLLVDVEFGRDRTLFGLSQGVWDRDRGTAACPFSNDPGTPACPGTGSLVRVRHDGSFGIVATDVNLPTSLEIVGDTAYVVNLAGEVWRYDDISGHHDHGKHGDRDDHGKHGDRHDHDERGRGDDYGHRHR